MYWDLELAVGMAGDGRHARPTTANGGNWAARGAASPTFRHPLKPKVWHTVIGEAQIALIVLGRAYVD